MRTSSSTAVHVVASAFILAWSPVALAQSDGGSIEPKCDPSTLICSNAPMPQKAQSDKDLDALDTHWLPACPGDPDTHCSDHPVQIRALIAFSQLASGGPIYEIDMASRPAVVDARWPDTKGLVLSLAGGSSDAMLKVAHGIRPSFSVYVASPVFTGEFSIDATQILDLLPAGHSSFDYSAMNSQKFSSWGFDKVTMSVSGGADVKNSQLFKVNFRDLGKLVQVDNVDDYVDGEFSLNAISTSTFTYQTTSVKFLGADKDITSQTGTTPYSGLLEDYVDITANAKGVLEFSGEVQLLPVITITKIANRSVPNIVLPAGPIAKATYASNPVTITFPTQTVHIPLPNLSVPTEATDFGTTDPGDSSEKTVVLENTGKLAVSILDIKSNSSAFVPDTSATRIEAEDQLELPITFKPSKAGTYKAKITIRSNDPDKPEQYFEVSGGQGEEIPPDDSGTAGTSGSEATPTSSDTGGCGCRTTPSSHGLMLSSLTLLGLGLAFLRRRSS